MNHTRGRTWPVAVAAGMVVLGAPLLAQQSPPRGQSAIHIGAPVDVPSPGIAMSSRRDVTISPNGTAFLLDSRSDRVLAFSPSGALRTTLDLTPAGATADVAGYLIAPYQADGLLVYDAFAGRVHAYRWTGHDHLAQVGVASVGNAMAKDLCAIGDTIFVLSNRDGLMIHAFRLRGGLIRSFGVPPGSNRFVQSALVDAGGRLACSASRGAVIASLTASGTISAFRGDGSPLWRYTVPTFSGLSIRTMPDSSVQMAWDGAARDAVVSILTVGPDHVAVQVRRFTGATSALETTLLRLEDGRVAAEQRDLPMMRRAAGTSMITTEGAPPLHAEVYGFRLETGGR